MQLESIPKRESLKFIPMEIVSRMQNRRFVYDREMREGLIYKLNDSYSAVLVLDRVTLKISLNGTMDTNLFTLEVSSVDNSLYPIINMSPNEKNRFEDILFNMISTIRHLPQYEQAGIIITSNSVGHNYNLEGLASANVKADKAKQRSLYRERQLRKLFPAGKITRLGDYKITIEI